MKKAVAKILAFEAKILLARKKPKIIAVTGNVGKTSTKDAIYSVIKQKVSVRKSEKSYNSDIGVPLTILGIPNGWANPFLWALYLTEGMLIALFSRAYPDWLVLEMGVDRPGDMQTLTGYVRPDILVLTRFPDVPVHVEYFNTSEAVIEEKLELLKALRPEGIIVYNHDDEHIRLPALQASQQAIGFSRYSVSPFTVSSDRILYENGAPSGYEFSLTHGTEKVTIEIRGSLGVQYAYNYAAAIAVGSLIGVSLHEAGEALKKCVTAPGRMNIIAGIKSTTLIDDTYNASPLAVSQALMTLGEIRKEKHHTIAVLGDMLELGRYSIREHEKIGEMVAKNVDQLVTVGVRARTFAHAALEAGMIESNILQYDDARKAGNDLKALIQTGDVLLVKGSQSIRMERVVEELMAEPERAGELLVRQDSMWRRR